ncbi:MAG: hypothetical protein ACM3TN_06755 [Alphaproteobacteria bacterium]
MTLRWFLVGLAILLPLAFATVRANPYRDTWYFSGDEIEAAYRYQLNFGERISHPIKGRNCLFGEKNIQVAYRGRQFPLSCRFVTQTISQISQMLEVGAAKYLFPLDADHAHLAVPKNLWEEKYSKLAPAEILPAILQDPSLVALYHTAEHLAAADPVTGKVDPKDKAWKEKRNVLGYYDGRRIKILPPNPAGAGVGLPDTYHSYGGFRFLASPGGQLNLFYKNGAIVFDISLDFGETSDDPSSVL